MQKHEQNSERAWKFMMCQNAEDTEVSTEEFDMVRSTAFSFHSVQSIINTKLRTTNQTTELCKYKTDISRDSNLMPIKMFKVLSPNTKIMDLNKSIDKNNIACMQ